MAGTATADRPGTQVDDTPRVRDFRPKSRELVGRMARIFEEATKDGMTLSAKLERIDPSNQYSDYVGLDAFERCLAVQGIRVTSDPVRGIWASPFDSFVSDKNDANGMAMLGEFINRTWRATKYGGLRDYSQPQGGMIVNRATIGSDQIGAGSVLRPYVDAAGLRQKQIAPSIPISELVAITTSVDNDTYRAAYLTEPTAAQLRMVRVAQGTDLPRTRISTKQNAIYLHKYGRAVETTYEALRRLPIDMVALLFSRIAVQADVDKVGAILDVIINGDGNSGTSAVVDNLTTLDPTTTANNLTLLAWLAFLFNFPNPYALTTALGQSSAVLKLATVNVGTSNQMLAQVNNVLGIGSIRPINPEFSNAVAVGVTTDAPSGKLVAIDNRYAVERVTEAGADITETMRWIINQTEILTISEVEGYSILDANATRILNLAA
jgi:hypothetical protein